MTLILLAERLRGPKRLRGRVEVPGGTYSLADGNIGAAEQIRYDTGV